MKKPAPIQLSIPLPCTQAWEEMQPIAGGRHCASCEKAVTDFSRMTDAQILNYFLTFNGPACGRFRPDQLDRVIQAVEVPRSGWWARVAAGLLMALGLSKTADGQSSRTTIPVVRIQAANDHPLTGQSLKELNPVDFQLEKAQLVTVRGTLIDGRGNHAVQASVKIYGSTDTLLGETVTGLDGEYIITVEITNRIFSVGFSFLGPEIRSKYLFEGNSEMAINGRLPVKSQMSMTVGMIIRSYENSLPQPPGQKTIRAEMIEHSAH